MFGQVMRPHQKLVSMGVKLLIFNHSILDDLIMKHYEYSPGPSSMKGMLCVRVLKVQSVVKALGNYV